MSKAKDGSNRAGNLLEKLRRNKFASAVLTLVTGTALGQAISLVTVPIVSRLYDQVAYGEYAIIISCSTIIGTVSQAGLASAIMAPEVDKESREVFSASFWMAFVLTAITVGGMGALSNVARIFDLTIPYGVALGILFVYSILNGANNLLRIYMNRCGLYNTLFWNSLIGALATLLITIPLGFVGSGVAGFMIADILGKLVCAVQMLVHANPFVKIKPKQVWGIIVRYRRYVLFQFPANFVHTCTQQLPNQVLEAAFGNSVLGSYSMSNKILAIPSRLIATPISTAYFKTASDYHREKKDLGAFTFKLVKLIMLCAAPLVIICIAFGESIFTFVLGEKWRQAGTISAILIVWYMLDFCFSSTSYCRVAINRQKANLVISIVCLAINISGFVVGLLYFGDLMSTIICFGIAGSISKIVDLEMNFICLESHVKQFSLFTGIYIAALLAIGLIMRGNA